MYNEPPESEEPKVSKFTPETEEDSLTYKLNNWYKSLSQPAQVLVMTGGVIVGFAILNLFLRVVISLITLAILGSILYIIYRFWKSSQS